MTQHHGFLWIKGKPGTGKSTIMKFIHAKENRPRDKIVLVFFFNARGDRLEKSTEGLYRSLLFRLLTKIPELQSILATRAMLYNEINGAHWPIESLKDLFEEACEQLNGRALTLVVDALDECDDDEIREMATFFDALGHSALLAGRQLRICLSSRHHPHISVKHGLSITLEHQEEHRHDIERYIRSELYIGKSERAEKIRGSILEKSSGIFLWVALVIPLLNKAYDKGRMTGMEMLLKSTPTKLEELFENILFREGDQARHSDEKHQSELCSKWVLHARRPLTLRELYFAILAGTDVNFTPFWAASEVDDKDMSRFVLDCSRGLVEETKAKVKTVQFIHESVREYFLSGSISIIDDDMGASMHEVLVQEQLTKCCLLYLQKSFKSMSVAIDSAKNLPKANTTEASELRESHDTKLPFMKYAIEGVLYHCNAASARGIPQIDILEAFDLKTWVYYWNVFEKFEVRRYQKRATASYILADQDLASLLGEQLSLQPLTDIREGRYGFPLMAARVRKNTTTIATLLSPRDGRCNSALGPFLKPSDQDYQNATTELLHSRPWATFSPKLDFPLDFAIDAGFFSLARCIIASQRIMPIDMRPDYANELWGDLTRYPLPTPNVFQIIGPGSPKLVPKLYNRVPFDLSCLAALSGDKNIVTSLLRNHTLLDTIRFPTDQKLSKGIACDLHQLLSILIKCGARVAEQLLGQTTPSGDITLSRSYVSLARSILDRAIETCEVFIFWDRWQTFSVASKTDPAALVPISLDTNDIEDTENSLCTLLLFAASMNRRWVAEVLLKVGANPNKRIPFSQLTSRLDEILDFLESAKLWNATMDIELLKQSKLPTWYIACLASHYDVFSLLIEHGANFEHPDNLWPPALHIAIARRDERKVKRILENGADPNLIWNLTDGPMTPLKYLRRTLPFREGEQLLLCHGAIINA